MSKYDDSRLIYLSCLRKYEMTFRCHLGILTRIRISVIQMIMFTVLSKSRSLFIFTRDVIDEMFCFRIIIIIKLTIKIGKTIKLRIILIRLAGTIQHAIAKEVSPS